MSYDVTIGSESFNHTGNTSRLFDELIPGNGTTKGIEALHGLNGAEAAEHLESGLDKLNHMQADLGEAAIRRDHDAKNGWGSVLTSALFLSAILSACHRHPFEKVEVC